MGGESGYSRRVGSIQDMMPSGTETELLRIGGAQLYLLDGEESVLMGAGDFALIMMVQANTPLATLVAQVAEFQWPVGKDGPVLKIANLRYTFSIPGLAYGLILPESTPQDFVVKFENQMRKYCTFEIRPEIAEAAGVSDLQRWSPVGRSVDGASEGARYWTAIADGVESYSVNLVRQINSGSTVAANSILKGSEWASWGIKQGGSYVKRNINSGIKTDGEVSPRMQKRVDQARRMSAVAKLLSRTVLKGVISATGHVASFLGTAIGGAPPVKVFMSSDARREVAVASVDAFAKVVEAVETAGKSVAMTTTSVGTEILQHKFGEQAGQVAQNGMGAMGVMIDSIWTLNKVGLRLLWETTTATAFSNAHRKGGASSRAPSKSMTPDNMTTEISHSTESSPPYSNASLKRQASSNRTISLSPPRIQQGEALRTAQFFPSAGSMHSQSQIDPVTSPNVYMQQQAVHIPPGYATYYHPPHHPNSPFQQYTRPGAPPQVQSFFPFRMDAGSKSQ